MEKATLVALILYYLLLYETFGTVDINLAEFNYLANHLLPEECRKLAAALHFSHYENKNAVDEAERRIPEDISCLRLLLHWNSAAGEGLGETHEILRERLIFIGRKDLADWLGKTVFKELGAELENDLDNPFKEILTETTENTEIPPPTLPPKAEYTQEWIPFDTICFGIIASLGIGTFFILCIIFWSKAKKAKKQKTNTTNLNEYTKINQIVSDSESEDQFDIRNSSTIFHD